PEEIRYHPIGPYAPGGVLDGPSLPELTELTAVQDAATVTMSTLNDALEAIKAMPYDSQLDMPEEDIAEYGEVADGLLEALRNCDRATPRPGFTTKVVRDSWELPAEGEDGPHEHTWIDERELCSTWVRRYCPGCGADESYDDAPEVPDLHGGIAYRRHPNPELCPMDCPDCD